MNSWPLKDNRIGNFIGSVKLGNTHLNIFRFNQYRRLSNYSTQINLKECCWLGNMRQALVM
jgi:hypothetical protein